MSRVNIECALQPMAARSPCATQHQHMSCVLWAGCCCIHTAIVWRMRLTALLHWLFAWLGMLCAACAAPHAVVGMHLLFVACGPAKLAEPAPGSIVSCLADHVLCQTDCADRLPCSQAGLPWCSPCWKAPSACGAYAAVICKLVLFSAQRVQCASHDSLS